LRTLWPIIEATTIDLNFKVKMFRFLNKPYDLLEFRRFEILYIYGISVFNFIFLLIFKPFGLYNLIFIERIRTLIVYFLVIFPVILVNSYLLKRFFFKNYTLGNTILWFIWSFLLISIGIFIVNTYLFNDGRFYFSLFLWSFGITLCTAVIPITILILFHYNYVLIGRLNNAQSINEILKNKKINHNKEIIFEDENNNKKVSVSLDSLLYITAADNYIDVYYFDKNKISHELIRNSLTNIEKTFANTKQLIRCHKSFIINLNNVISLTGNTVGYKLKLKNADVLIPVSRKLNSRIIEIFEK